MPEERGFRRRPPDGRPNHRLGDAVGMLVEIGLTIVMIAVATAIAVLATRGRPW